MRKCILHIGSPKTGTTSIQAVLKRNRGRFLAQGILVPTAGQKGKGIHPSLAHSLAGLPVRPEWAGAEESFIRELEATNPHTVVISAEILWRVLGEEHKPIHLIEKLKSLGFDVELLCYVRNQPQYLNSSYSQGIKSFQHGMRFDRYVDHHLERPARLVYTRRMEAARGHGAKFLARPFSAEIRKTGLIDDFLRTLGVSAPDTFEREAQLNQSVSPLHVAAARKLYRRTLSKQARTTVLAREFGRRLRNEIEMLGIEEPSYVGLDAEKALRIQEACREDNDRFALMAWGRSWSETFAADVAQTYECNDYELTEVPQVRRRALRQIVCDLEPQFETLLKNEGFQIDRESNVNGAFRKAGPRTKSPVKAAAE